MSREHSQIVRNSLLAGSASGIVSTTALYPMDVIRTKMQSGSVLGTLEHAGPFETFRHTIQHGGVRALYTGIALPLAAQAVYKGTVFTVNNLTEALILSYKRQSGMKDARLASSDRFISGCVGGGVNALLFVTPVEFIRNQMIAQHSRLASGQSVAKIAKGSLDVVYHSIQDHGFFSLWKGAGISTVRDAWGCGWFFLTMGFMRGVLGLEEKPSFVGTVTAGGVSGLAFWVSSLPLDTVKTWVQSACLTEKTTVRQAVSRAIQQYGFYGFVKQLFRGWQVAYGRGIPSAALTMTVYTLIYERLQASSNM